MPQGFVVLVYLSEPPKKNGKAASENVLLRVNVRMIQNSAPLYCVMRVTTTKTTQSNLETPESHDQSSPNKFL